MLTVSALIDVLRLEQSLGITALPVPRDHCSDGYYARRQLERSLQEPLDSPYKLKIEFSKASRLDTKEEYLHSNTSYY